MTTISVLPPPRPEAHVTIFRAHDPGYVAVFVEGADDVETLRPWLKWRPVETGGCGPLLAAINSLRTAGESGYVGLLDADCERLEGRDHSASDVIVTETHDLECDIFRLPALERLLGTIEDGRVSALLGTDDIRAALLHRAVPFGLLRWHFFRLGTQYPQGRLSPNLFIRSDTWTLDLVGLRAAASNALGETVPNLTAALDALSARVPSLWEVTNGHDLIEILAIALRGPLAAKAKYPHSKVVSSAIRLAIDSTHRAQLRVWRQLQNWESMNQPWRVCIP